MLVFENQLLKKIGKTTTKRMSIVKYFRKGHNCQLQVSLIKNLLKFSELLKQNLAIPFSFHNLKSCPLLNA